VQIQIEQLETVLIFRPSCEIMMSNVRNIRELISQAISGGASRILIDMRSVPYVDSSGLGLILSVALGLRETGGDLKLFGVGEQTRKILRLHHLDSKIAYYETEAEAIQSFA